MTKMCVCVFKDFIDLARILCTLKLYNCVLKLDPAELILIFISHILDGEVKGTSQKEE